MLVSYSIKCCVILLSKAMLMKPYLFDLLQALIKIKSYFPLVRMYRDVPISQSDYGTQYVNGMHLIIRPF
jgi:hypothetical protein